MDIQLLGGWKMEQKSFSVAGCPRGVQAFSCDLLGNGDQWIQVVAGRTAPNLAGNFWEGQARGVGQGEFLPLHCRHARVTVSLHLSATLDTAPCSTC